MKGLRAVSEAKLRDSQPGESVLNAKGKRFECRDDQGHALAMEVEEADGHQVMSYCTAWRVTRGVSLYDPGFLAAWLEASNEGQYLGTDWQALAYSYTECRQEVMQARCRAGQLTVRCTGCRVAASETMPKALTLRLCKR